MHLNFCNFFCIFTLYYLSHFALVDGQSNGDLRLSLGHEGLLEIYYDGWGSVCSVGWDRKDSNVACRSLGFGSAVSYQTYYYHPNYTREFKISNVNCTGIENNILECGYSMTLSNCHYHRHVFLDCSFDYCRSYLHIQDIQAQVVQYFNGQHWFYICRDNFSEENAHVICYENYGTESLNYFYLTNNSLTFGYSFYPYQHKCRGSEASLCNCPTVNQTCQSIEAVVIRCREPDYGTIRLINNNGDKLLQAYINSSWIDVCTNIHYFYYIYFELMDYVTAVLSDTMDIACRELGYSKASSFRLIYDYNQFNEEYRLYLGYCNKYDTKISYCADTYIRKDNYCGTRVSLSCQTDSCEAFLQLNATSNSFQLAQIYTDKTWSYICYDDFTLSDADVMCKETAFVDAISFEKVQLDDLSQQPPVSHYNYSCTGNESSICNCPAERTTCDSNKVVNVLCDNPSIGSIRLSYGYFGYIEVYNGEWRIICNYTRSSVEEDVICRSAGFRRNNLYDSINDPYFNFPWFINYFLSNYDSRVLKSIGNVHCFGNETDVLDCSYTNYTGCDELKFVRCEKGGCESLVNNPGSLEAVQIYNNLQWYSLCKDNFTQQTADVICGENYGSNARLFIFKTIQSINYLIYPFYLQCDGNENSVCACHAISQTCSSNQIVYVECNGLSNGHLQLTNGASGLLEVFLNGWKSVCGLSYQLNQAISNVVCRYLGYRDAGSFNSINIRASKQLQPTFRCLGNETNILECQYYLQICNYISYISCRTEGCQSYISEEHTTNEPVKFYTNEDWYYLCANFISTKEANVICRENGFRNGAQSIMSMLRSQLSISFEIYPYNISCQGDESSLCNCSMIQSQCQDNNIAVIRCFAPVQGTLRYSDQYRNLLEIYNNGGWSHICYYNWGYPDSDVACRQLGYTRSNGYSATTTTNIATSYPNTFGNVKCIGNESSLIDCDYKITNCQSDYYYYTYRVILYCTRGDCEVQAPFTTDNFQIVEYFADNLRYYLCADGFTGENADVVCRETSNTVSISHQNASELNLPPNTQIYPFQHSCFGNEYSLCNCSTYLQSCTSGLVVEVQCGTPAFGTIRDFSISNFPQVYSNGWKYICGSSFNVQNAIVACRQQGFRTYRNWNYVYSNEGTYWNRILNCRGNETKLLDCSYTSISNCNRRLRLYCEIGNCDSILINGNQTLVPVRYYDGHANYYLCKEGFTLETANVVCHREGYGDVMTIGETQPNNTGFNYAISNRVYTCNGNEYSICNCSVKIQNCESGNIAKFQCNKPEQGRLRFTTQNTLQLYYNQWRGICNQRWDTTDSDVACRQLGYRYAISFEISDYLYYYNPNGYVSDVICIGNETRVIDCKYHLSRYCSTYWNWGVLLTCYSGGCQSYALDASSFPQIVRYYTNGWYYLCRDGFTRENADVVCRENEGTLSLSFSNAPYADINSDIQILERKFECTGREKSLCDCASSTALCPSNTVVKLQCNQPAYGHIRLSNRDEGVLEIYLNRWGYVCDDGWNRAASEVVCSQLGLEPLTSFKTGVEVNNLLYPFLLDDVKCYGNESSLFECSHTLRHDCQSGEHVSITCGFNETTVPSKNVTPVMTTPQTSTSTTVLPVPDAPPQNVTATTLSGTIINVCFNPPPAINQNGPITSFNITYTGGAFDTTTVTTQLPVSPVVHPLSGMFCVNLTGLQEFNNYYISVVAINDAGAGPASSALTHLTDQAAPDAAPQNVTATTLTATIINVCFYPPPAINQNGPITSFNITYTGGTFDTTTVTTQLPVSPVVHPLSGMFCVNLTGLQEFNNYNISVVAINGVGAGTASSAITQLTDQAVPATPPININVTVLNSTVINVEWNAPALIDQNGVLTLYQVQYNGAEIDTVSRTRNASSSTFSLSLTGLEAGANYCVSVRVENEVGFSVFSTPLCVRTQEVGVAPNIISPNMNITKKINGTEADIASIECLAIGDPTPDVYWTRDFEERFVDSPTLQISITDLANGGKVFYCVAQNSAGKVVVSVTYKIVLTTEDVQEAISDVMKELNNTESISDEKSGQAADKTKVVIDSVNDNVDIKGENKSKLLESAATTTALIVNKTNGTFSNETTEKITGLLSSIVLGSSDIEESDTETETQQGEQSTVATIPAALAITLITLERFSQRLSVQLKDTEVNTVRIVESQLITIVVQNVALDNSDDNNETKAKIILPIKSSDDVQYSVMIELSIDLALTLSTDGKSLAIATSIVKRIESTDSDSSETKQGSDILTIAIAGKSGTVELSQKVTLSFDVYSSKPSESICVFLNSTSWVSNGLVTEQKTFNFTNCESKHFTSFAVFVTPHKNNKPYIESIALSVISYLFVGISFISLLISLILFIAAGKPFFKVEANIIYFNYCLSMLLATGLFIFGIQVGTYNLKLCKTIAFLLHYSWLAVFTWTLCIGILVMYKIVISVLSTRKIYGYLIAFGWIFPINIPIITIIITRDYYVDSKSHCFLNIAGGVIWSFIAPIFIIIIINAVFLIISLIRIIQTKSANQNDETRDIIKSALITGLVLTPVLGLPWLFLLFNIAIRHSALEWIFIIINGLMGLIFLLVVVIRNKEVVALFKKNKETASTNTHPSPRHAVSSSATGSTFTSNRFKKTNTLERQLVKESEIEAATIEPYGVHNSPYSTTENAYEVDSEEKKAYEAGMSEQTFTGYENPLYSSIGDDPPVYQNLSKMGMVTEIHTNPMYMQSPVPAQGYTNELYADVTELNESNAVYSDETQLVDD